MKKQRNYSQPTIKRGPLKNIWNLQDPQVQKGGNKNTEAIKKGYQ